MKRTTVKLPDDVDTLLRREAERRGTTISTITREAIEAYLGVGVPRHLYGAGVGSSGRTDISRRIEEILLEEIPRSH